MFGDHSWSSKFHFSLLSNIFKTNTLGTGSTYVGNSGWDTTRINIHNNASMVTDFIIYLLLLETCCNVPEAVPTTLFRVRHPTRRHAKKYARGNACRSGNYKQTKCQAKEVACARLDRPTCLACMHGRLK